MKQTSQTSAVQALRSIPAGAFLRYNPDTFEMELMGQDGQPLAAEKQHIFFTQMPEGTLATLKASLMHCA